MERDDLSIAFIRTRDGHPDPSLEWLVTNGIGGYASGTVASGISRRYHGLLIAALPAPFGRILYLSHLRTSVLIGSEQLVIDHEDARRLDPSRVPLAGFWLEQGLPVWRFESDGFAIERRVVMPHEQNTTHVLFRRAESRQPIRLRLQPFFRIRPHEARLAADARAPEHVEVTGTSIEISAAAGLPQMRWQIHGADVTPVFDQATTADVTCAIEEARGYDCQEQLWSPGWIDLGFSDRGDAAFVVSTESWDTMRALAPADALEAERSRRDSLLAQAGRWSDPVVDALVLAADQFLIAPVGRPEEVARARAAGDDARTVIAGYHWFTDWGRDTMISLEGLALSTGRAREAGCILRTFAHYVRDGLIPNMFPEGERLGLYHTADATLWFFHALDRYLAVTGDDATLQLVLPRLVEIAERHLSGTRFGIQVDPVDGLLTQGAEGYQLTWMDAKVGDWVVTPRRGKAVEINALWYNALRLLTDWLRASGDTAAAERYAASAAHGCDSFNRRFWNESTGYLFDVIDGEQGDDPACRPNQILAISLRHPVLSRDRWEAVVAAVDSRLATPVGLRSLSREHPDYQARYYGDLRARDAAYHQGTVWAWLIGPFIDAWLKVHPDRSGAHARLRGFVTHLRQAGTGSISEIFDGELPHTPRGCIAQAWSVAELLRVWLKTSPATT
jgi:predicted glycogen debranching enzyme